MAEVCSRFCRWIVVTILGLKLSRVFEAEFWSRFWSWSLVNTLKLKLGRDSESAFWSTCEMTWKHFLCWDYSTLAALCLCNASFLLDPSPINALYGLSHVNRHFLKFIKVKIHFLLIFLSKNDYFSSVWCKIVQILEWIFGCEVTCKKREGGSEKFEIWCAQQLGRA